MIRFTATIALLFLSLLYLAGRPLPAAEYGDLTGRFLYDGKPPKRKKIEIRRDLHSFGKVMLHDESLIVGKNRGIANVVVYLKDEDGVAVHPEYEKTKDTKVTIRTKKCRFEPHIVPIRLTQMLVVHNQDPVAHNFHMAPYPLNPLLPPNYKYQFRFDHLPKFPIQTAGCDVHVVERVYVVVRKTPYVAVSGADGKFTIKNLPAGKELVFRVWHESSGWVENGNWKRGVFKVTIPTDKGSFDLGDLKLSPKQFELKESK